MKTYKIVLIEDNPADVFLIEEALRENEVLFEMVRFEDGEDALKALNRDSPPDTSLAQPVDIIILDLNTPRMDGLEVLKTLRESRRHARTPIAIVTSSELPADRRNAETLGATCYLQKPAQLAEFIERIGGTIAQVLRQ